MDLIKFLVRQRYLDAFDFSTEMRLETSESRNSDVTETPISNDERTHLVQKISDSSFNDDVRK